MSSFLAPRFELLMAVGTEPDDWAEPGTIWYPIPHLRHATWERGRIHALEFFDEGSAAFRVMDLKRYLDPDSYPPAYADPVTGENLIRTEMPIRLVAYYGGETKYLFTGFIDDIEHEEVSHNIIEARITATDGIKHIGLERKSVTYSEERSDERIEAILDHEGWPAAERVLRQGASTVIASELANTSLRDHLNRVVRTEFGAFWVDGRGRARYDSRDTLASGEYIVPRFTFGGETGLPYHRPPKRRHTNQRIWNHVIASREGGEDVEYSDVTSIGRYKKRSIPGYENLLFPTDEEVVAATQFLVESYKNPRSVIEPLYIHHGLHHETPHQNDLLYKPMLELELQDRVGFVRRYDRGGRYDLEAHISNIKGELDFSGEGTISMEYELTLPPLFQLWLLENSVRGVMGETTNLGF